MSVTMENDINIENTKLVYVAEGNANIVLKLPEYKHVLRLPKTETAKSKRTDLAVFIYLSKCRKYVEILMQLVSEKYIYLPYPIEISKNAIEKLNEFMTPFRPKSRLDKKFNGIYGLLMLDATMGSASETTYSVEIKPKQGWFFQEVMKDLIDTSDIKMCRYCCMQYLKIKHGKISKRSKYCPMDLFSGKPCRIQTAFDGLLENPQNNLRIFKNGELIYGEGDGNRKGLDILFNDLSKNDFYSILTACLLNSASIEIAESKVSKSKFLFCDPESSLPATSILKKVIDLQSLSKLNLQYMCKLKMNDGNSYHTLESLVLKNSIDCLDQLSPEEQYMVGATLMDASLMITFHQCNNEKISGYDNIKVVSGRRYYTKITLLDLDPKSDNHFKKYLKQTNDACKAVKDSKQITQTN